MHHLKRNYHNQAFEACRQVFWEWLSGKGRKPTTWSTVITALYEIERAELAKDLEYVLEASGK